MQQVVYKPEKAEPFCNDEKLVLFPNLVEDVLLKLLRR